MACTSAWEMCTLWQRLTWWSSASSTRCGTSLACSALEPAVAACQTIIHWVWQAAAVHRGNDMALDRLGSASLGCDPETAPRVSLTSFESLTVWLH